MLLQSSAVILFLNSCLEPFPVTLAFVSLLACGGLGLLTLPTGRGCLLGCIILAVQGPEKDAE